MKSFKQFIFEQKQPPPPVKIPVSGPATPSIDPRDLEVINAFFRGEPDVMGTNIITKQNDDKDFNDEELRIDLLFGRGRLGVAKLMDDIIYLGELDTMVDRTPASEQTQAIVRNMARDRGMRVI
tara:strand:+ start:352 stop:723 length:372 start_codon:yes stop_codon:yes gene_type:complete